MQIPFCVLLICILQNFEILNAKSLRAPKNIPPTPEPRSNAGICSTPACKEAATQILNDMDPKAAPCDNFYKFACGNFLKTSIIPEDATYIDKFSFASGEFQAQLRSSLEEEVQPNELRAISLAKNFYKACMKRVSINKQDVQTLLDELKTIGGWPLLKGATWKDASFDWKEAIYKFRRLGFSADSFFTFNVGIDVNNFSKRALNIDQPSLGVSRPILLKGLKDPNVKAYYNYMVDVAVLFGADKTKAEKAVKEVLEFEIKLASITENIIRAVRMSVKQLSQNFKNIPWKTFFNSIVPPNIQIDDTEMIVVHGPLFFERFGKLMSETPNRIKANYFIQKIVQENIGLLPADNREPQEDLTQFDDLPLWKECSDMTTRSLGLSVSALYIKKYFNDKTKKNTFELVNNIYRQFKKIIKQVDWMDDKTKKIALEKAEPLGSQIAFPDELLDDKKLEEFYKDLVITPDNYLAAATNLSLFLQKYSFSELRKPVKNSDWTFNSVSTIINAAYLVEENTMQVSAGILRNIFYNTLRPQCMNFAAIGSIFAHEITYAFGAASGEIDKDGNMKQWWTEETKKRYDAAKANCIVDQYGMYTPEEAGLKLDGNNTQVENIAYNGGIRASYEAYQEYVRQKGPEPTLVGLQYTPSQLFWITAAQTWCTKYTPEELKLLIHNPAEFRILGALSNRPEFAKDFNCPMNSNMNPGKKCSAQ